MGRRVQGFVESAELPIQILVLSPRARQQEWPDTPELSGILIVSGQEDAADIRT